MALREPIISEVWFKDRHGCAEKPSLDKIPDVVSIPKLKVMSTNVKDEHSNCIGCYVYKLITYVF